MITALLGIWAVAATFAAIILLITLQIQQSQIELLESEVDFAERELEAVVDRQKFQPCNRVFGGYSK